MLGFGSSLKVWLATEAVDFRKGIDGLCGIVRERFSKNPLDGEMFVFINRSHKSIRILFYDSQGFWLCQKRLSSGRFRNWPRGSKTDASIVSLVEAELSVLLRGGRINNLYLKPAFRQIREVFE
jgi:hypothetical protein